MQALGVELRGELRTIQQPLGWFQLTRAKEACPSDLFLGILPLESKPDSLAEMSHPPPSLASLTLYQLGLVAMNFLSLELRLRHCRKQCDSLLDKASARRCQHNNNNNNNKHQHRHHNTNNNNNNNNNDDNNDNDNNTNQQESSLQSLDQNKASQESSLNSFDLDNENPESSFGSDLDRSSLDSFAQDGETGFSSSDHQGEAPSLTNLGTTMTIGFSLGSLTQNNQEGNGAWNH